MSILQCIGNTPITTIDLNPNPGVTLFAKLEGNNPGGSVKDRIALSMIEAAEKEGRPLPQALAEFEAAAQKGMASTRDMLAKIGRASRLGERTIGHQDAGATSCYFILRSLASAASH